jgi:OmpA-OmpF porin, OOP family
MRLKGIAATAAVGALTSSLFASDAKAGDPPFDPAIDVQLFDYSIGPKSFFTVADADVSQQKALAMDFLITFLTNPLTVYNVAPGENMITGTRTQVVKSMLAGQLSGAYGLSEKLQLGAMLPMIFNLTGDGLDPATAMRAASELRVAGLGDLALELKYRLQRTNTYSLAAMGGLTVPSSFGSGGSKFIGDDLPTLRAKFAAQFNRGVFTAGVNIGAIFRKPRTIYASEVGQQLTWGAGAAVRVTPRFQIVGEAFGRTGLAKFDLDRSPTEASGGIRVLATNSWAVVAGGGAGLVKGIGSPDVRAFLSLGYAPDIRDTDGDGIANGRDNCIEVAEDRDGFEDRDGCPDPDNDGDRRDDTVDKCPDAAEDLDGFDDEDGCPELDNDGDNIADLEDKCSMDKEDGKAPNPTDGCPFDKRDSDGDGLSDNVDACPTATEDTDGFEDDDGCPEADNDNDGVLDATDACALCAEDKDGYQDTDGCPDFDDDHDGVADTNDKCPKEPETVNGITDGDGCPDSGGLNMVRIDGDRLVVDKAPPFDAKGLTRGGDMIVEQMALVMKANPDVTQWLIAFGGGSNAAKEAQWLKAKLVSFGLAESSLEVVGVTGPSRIGGVIKERAEADAPKTCPASMEVKPKTKAAAVPAIPITPSTPATKAK